MSGTILFSKLNFVTEIFHLFQPCATKPPETRKQTEIKIKFEESLRQVRYFLRKRNIFHLLQCNVFLVAYTSLSDIKVLHYSSFFCFSFIPFKLSKLYSFKNEVRHKNNSRKLREHGCVALLIFLI